MYWCFKTITIKVVIINVQVGSGINILYEKFKKKKDF